MTRATQKRIGFTLVAALLLSASFTQARADSACHYIEQASLDISPPPQSTVPTVSGEINGKPVKMLLDTGSYGTLVLRAEADRQNLNPERINRQVQGKGFRHR
jgi:hypothetical protein